MLKVIIKSVFWGLMVFAAVSMGMAGCGHAPLSAIRIRDSVVMLLGAGQCTGVQVTAPSGKNYILTAAHCKFMAIGGAFAVIDERGRSNLRSIIAEDGPSDLLLVEEAPHLPSLPVTDHLRRGDRLRSFTHGAGLPTYETQGVMIDVSQVTVGPVEAVDSKEAEAACAGPKYSIQPVKKDRFCMMQTVQSVTTVLLVPGSSGGPIVNEDGELVGIASSIDPPFSYVVNLGDIIRFLKDI